MRRRWRFIVPLLATGSCLEPTGPAAGPVATLEIVSGDLQTGTVGADLPHPIVVRTLDAAGTPIQNQIVNFRVVKGGGSVFAGAALTNAGGYAQERWTLGTSIADSQVVQARAVDAATGAAVVLGVFRAIPEAGPLAALAKLEGDGQEAIVGSAVAIVPRVRASDAFGNPKAGTPITFRAVGGGSVTGPTQTTDAEGIASVGGWVVSTLSGENQLAAAAPGLPEVFFAASAYASVATRLILVSSPPSVIAAGVSFGDTIVRVQAVDDLGNAARTSVTIRAAVAEGEGTLGGSTVKVTPASGLATFDDLRINGLVGTRKLSFSATGLSPVLSGDIQVQPGPNANAIRVSGDGQDGMVGTNLTPPVVRVIDAFGNRVAGTVVTFAVTTGGGTVIGAAQSTNANGEASPAQWTLGPSVGTNTLRAIASGGPSSNLIATFTAQARSSQVLVVSGNNGMAVAGQPLGTPIRVKAVDELNRIVVGAQVSFVVTEGGGSVTAAVAATGSDGIAEWTGWTLGAVGINRLEARVSGALPALLSATAYPQFVALDVAPSSTRACALDVSGSAFCWGPKRETFLSPTPAMDTVPRSVGVGGFSSLSTGTTAEHYCALTPAGQAYCWGENDKGQIGQDLSVIYGVTPTPLPWSVTFARVATGGAASCGLTPAGDARCWGSGRNRQLGNGNVGGSTPASVLGGPYIDIAVGYQHSCALAADSTAYCWGNTAYGQAGTPTPETREVCSNGSDTCINSPVQMAGGHHFKSITAGTFHTCALTAAGTAYCWGKASALNLTADSPVPIQVSSGQSWTALSAGVDTCGIAADQKAYCWGNGTTVPTVVAGNLSFRKIRNAGKICGITTSDMLWCWRGGPAGDGSLGTQPAPRPVIRR